MKSERRHELQTNLLADWLGRQIDALRPYAGVIGTAVVAIAAVLAAWMLFLRWNSAQSTAAWSDFYHAAAAGDAASLTEMAEQHASEPASMWAMLLAADTYLGQGAQAAFTDRKEAENLLTRAIKTYELVVNQVREPILTRRALYGLAEAYEARYAVVASHAPSKEDLNQARKLYQQVAEQWPETALGRAAQRKAEALASPATQEFLVWFSEQQPTSAATPGAATDAPFDLGALPGAGELQLPGEDGKTGVDSETTDGGEPKVEGGEPEGSAPPVPEQEANLPEAPSLEAPAAPEPAADTPAEPTPTEPAEAQPAETEAALGEKAPANPPEP